MLRRTAIAAVLAALAVAAPLPSTALAVPVPLAGCASAAATTLPCRPAATADESALTAAARSGADVVRKVLSTASFGIF